MDYSNNKKVIITGASQGIGKSISLEFARKGFNVYMLARNIDKLINNTKLISQFGSSSYYAKCDVKNNNEVIQSFDNAWKEMNGIDIAILNAGIGFTEWFKEYDSEKVRKIFDVNFFGLIHCLEAIIPRMISQGYGTIVGISSLADARGIPGNSAYCSSKAAVTEILEAARIELKSYNIKVITVKPGFINTALLSNSDSIRPMMLSADEAASIIVRKILAGKQRIYFPMPMAILSKLGKCIPDIIYENVIKYFRKSII